MPETPRDLAYSAIDSEREYQDGMRSEPKTVGEYLTMLSSYLDEARHAWTFSVGDYAALQEIRKLTAIGVRCMEEHGAPHRVGVGKFGTNHVEETSGN